MNKSTIKPNRQPPTPIVGKMKWGGVIEMDPSDIDLNGTYTFESNEGGQTKVWTGVRPERGSGGRAVFKLSHDDGTIR